MCTAATYQTRDFYMGRTLDYEFSYGEEIVVVPRRAPSTSRSSISARSLRQAPNSSPNRSTNRARASLALATIPAVR